MDIRSSDLEVKKNWLGQKLLKFSTRPALYIDLLQDGYLLRNFSIPLRWEPLALRNYNDENPVRGGRRECSDVMAI